MDILLINPNTTPAMTAAMTRAAEAVAAPGTRILAREPVDGPASIEGYLDEAFAVPGVLRLVAEGERDGVAGHVIACFDDTGLDAARCLAAAPVLGIGEAAYHLASFLAGRFGVVTTLARSIPALRHNLVRYGLASRCSGVRAADVPVLDLDHPGSGARGKISDEIARAIRQDGAEAIVLGCAGMAALANDLSVEHGLPVIDGVTGAVKLIEALAGLGLRTSTLGGYARPRPKRYLGMFGDMGSAGP